MPDDAVRQGPETARPEAVQPLPPGPTLADEMSAAVQSHTVALDAERACGVLGEILNLDAPAARRTLDAVAVAAGLPLDTVAVAVVDGCLDDTAWDVAAWDDTAWDVAAWDVGAHADRDASVGARRGTGTMFRVVDTAGAEVYLPTPDPAEVVRACGDSPDVVPQVRTGDGPWREGLGWYSDLRGVLGLSPESLDEIVAVVLTNPLAAAQGSSTWKVALLDGEGRVRARGAYLREREPSFDGWSTDRLLSLVGLRRPAAWLDGRLGSTDMLRVARVQRVGG